MRKQELHDFLELKYKTYNTSAFISSDPVLIPHKFRRKEDIEIAGFLAATIAWGQRPVIIRNAERILDLMDRAPYDYLLNDGYLQNRKQVKEFCHRTFQGEDLLYFFKALSNIYRKHGGLEKGFSGSGDMCEKISRFRTLFFSFKAPGRTLKHVSDPSTGSSAKRINMFLRWMVRKDKSGVDFGIWKTIKPSELYLPLDVHTGNVGRKLRLLKRKQNDWKAVEEITASLRSFDPADPVKYDFALFGLGIFEGF